MTKRYVALARVSSREQEREGFSLEVQEEALREYARRHHGEIVRFFRTAETATRREERGTFRDLLSYCRRHAQTVDAVLFYKVDRAARNFGDFVEVESLQERYGIAPIFVSQPTENTPAGRMMRRTLANMASYYTEQQSLDVREGQERRVRAGLFVGHAPFGYRNVRRDGRGLVEVHAENAAKVRRIFELYARHGHTLDSLRAILLEEGVRYSETTRAFNRSTLHKILTDRSYLGDVRFRGQWYQGTHEALVDRSTFERVQTLLGGKQYRPHVSVYGAGMIECGHCGRPVVVEVKRKRTKNGEREYRYYRCADYNSDGHPKSRVTEADLDREVLALFAEMKVRDEKVHRWVVEVLSAMSRHQGETRKARVRKWQRELRGVEEKKDRLLDLRLADEIDAAAFSEKREKLRERESEIRLRLEAAGRQQSEDADLAVRVFELSQQLAERWDTSDIPEKRQILEILGLNWTLDDVSLVGNLRKPFDALLGEPIEIGGRGERI